MKRQHPEAALQKTVFGYLSAALDPERAMFRMVENNPRSAIAGANAKRRGIRSGTPDVLIWWRKWGNHFGAIELKSDRGRQSPAQRQFQIEFQRIDGCYALCRNMDAVELALAMWGVPMRTTRHA